MVIFYGSQTGTAEEFAGRLAKDCNRYGMKGMAADPEEFDMVSSRQQFYHVYHLDVYVITSAEDYFVI